MTVITVDVAEVAGTLAKPATGNRWRARLIESDAKGKQGSSGYYPREVLERDGPTVFASKPVYFDHPGESERFERPERSVRDLAGKIVSRPVMEADGLYADVEFYSWAAPIVSEMAGDIGMSIRASASVENTTDKGIRGPVITALHEAESVDLVTKAGAGGKLVSLLESARHEGRAPVGEAIVSDTQAILERAVAAAYPADNTWISDYDPEAALVYYSRRLARRPYDDHVRATFREGYTIANDGLTATLAGNPVEVRPRTEYVPVTADASEAASGPFEASHQPPAPAGQSTATESEETHMATTQIEETELGRLRQDAERVPTLESERDQATARATEAEHTARSATRRADAIEMIAENGHPFTRLERRGLLADLPTAEDGTLDRDRFTAALTEAAAEFATRQGAGTVHGFGQGNTDGVDYAAVAEKAVADAFGRQTKEA